MIKKVIGVCLAASLFCGMAYDKCEAKSNVLNTMPISFGTVNKSSNHAHSVKAIPKKIDFVLDSSYSRIQYYKSDSTINHVISEHYFYVDKPSEVDIHFINNSKVSIQHRIYDADANEFFRFTASKAIDKNLLLKPGRYLIETRTSSYAKGNIDFEIKGVARTIEVSEDAQNYDRHHAAVLSTGTEIVDYLPRKTKTESRYRYYKLVLANPTNVNFIIESLSKRCEVDYHLLDEDERFLANLGHFTDGHIFYNKQLNAGTYYLRVKRNDIHYEGGAYSIKIK